jgi:predicted CoA-binding protein
MKTGRIITADADIREILTSSKTVAIIGLSPKPDRDSYKVAEYLKNKGYTIIPVRPAQAEILGEKAYPALDDIPRPVDIVNVFRSAEQVMPHAHEALRSKPKTFWMQEGIENRDAAALLTAAGIDVVMNRCIKRDHAQLSG